MRQVKHKQVSFVNYFGNTVEVDENLLTVLEALRDFGVRTDYSCQGEIGDRCYFLATTKTLWPLMKIIFLFYWNGKYSKSTRQIIKSFIRGSKEIQLWLFPRRNNSINFQCARDAKAGGENYVISFTFSTEDGFRTAIRWPQSETHRVLNLLQETRALKNNNRKEQ